MGNRNSKNKKNNKKNKNDNNNTSSSNNQQQQQQTTQQQTTKQDTSTTNNNNTTSNTNKTQEKTDTTTNNEQKSEETTQPTTTETTETVTTETTEQPQQNTDKTEETTQQSTQPEEKTEEQFTPEVDSNGLFKFLDGVVTRQEINAMSNEEQNRFMDAIHTMSKNENGPGTSHFFRIAGYHGQPRPIYCSHGVETFPGWHRIYLKHFEDHLRLADRQNGNDGNIGLPYWDWTVNRELPKILRERWNEYPKDLFPEDLNVPSLTRASDRRIKRNIEQWGVINEANDCLLAVQHWVHASTGNEWASPYPSLESPHNSIHGIVGGNGGPMGSVAWAAFDIAFWLHHCNVDRIYEKYISLETDSAQEFEQYQDTQQRDLFEVEFRPFNTLYTTAYGPKDTFDTESIGFKYDKLPPTPKQELRAKPSLVVYPQVKVSDFESKCYQVHTFLVDRTKENEFNPPTSEDDFDDNPNYAGTRMIFGRGMECNNCATRPPYDIVIDVSKCLRDLNISRYNVKILTYVFETNTTEEVYTPHSETPLPDPIITGPLFEDNTSNLQQSSDDDQKDNVVMQNEIKQLQRYLARYGYYDDEIDGDFGSVTDQAVKDFQKAAGLTVDGIVGPETKKFILFNKRCSNIDGFANNNVKDDESKGERNYNQEKVTYSLGVIPGYLNKDNVLKIISSCFSEWGQYVNISFDYSEESEVDVKIEFNNVSGQEQNSILRFDGAGGVLGHSGKGYIYFDIAERWEYGYNFETNQPDNTNVSNLNDTNTWHRGQPKISYYYTLLHEIGHTLGLDHSNDGKDVMGPYYTPELTKLQEGDINRIKALYSDEQPQEEQKEEQQQEEQQQEENQENQENQEEQQQEEQPQEEQQQEENQENQENQDEQPQEEQPQEEQQEENQENQEEQPQE